MAMSERAAAVKAKLRTTRKAGKPPVHGHGPVQTGPRTGTIRSSTAEAKAKSGSVQSKYAVSPFMDGTLGLGVLSVPPKPVKR